MAEPDRTKLHKVYDHLNDLMRYWELPDTMGPEVSIVQNTYSLMMLTCQQSGRWTTDEKNEAVEGFLEVYGVKEVK